MNKLTGYGMPGVWHFGFVDTWSPGYLAFAASNHNGMIRMYEIFNQGGANTKKARLQGPQTAAPVVPPEPGAGGRSGLVDPQLDQLRETGVLTALELTSKFPQMVVENFYRKSINSLEAGSREAAACVRHSRRPARSDRRSIASSTCCGARPSRCIARAARSR